MTILSQTTLLTKTKTLWGDCEKAAFGFWSGWLAGLSVVAVEGSECDTDRGMEVQVSSASLVPHEA